MVKDKKDTTLAQQFQADKQAKKDHVATALQGTDAGDIWNDIKSMVIDMFALPDQVVEMHCTPVPADPNRLFLTTASTAVLPSLEAAINRDARGQFQHRFNVELVDKFVIVSRVPVSITDKYGIKS
jgi:hypothetical protein